MNVDRTSVPGDPSPGQHIATVGHEGRFWDVFLEFQSDPRDPDNCRARFAFSPADRSEGESPLRTIPVIIEPSWEEAVHKARRMEEHQLVAFLRSLLP